ncbi:DUF2071 domain-containing protein [Bernardetia sp. ABR2-2B]|uniref:YqjF family protein n=1 Tax=Bernardetia sp. ABR2-2B TaxID=3127472 RepID=UPI0030D1C47B
MSFLKAEWRKLAIANYEIDPNILYPYLPNGTELDFWEGKCYVSLIGFMFKNVRLLGVPIPFHINFEEVNLRFYVKRYDTDEDKMNNDYKRGVVFIKEIVPKPAITFVANTVYGENYQTMKMSHQWIENQNDREIEYTWQKNSKEKLNSIYLKTEKNLSEIEKESKAEFITEHYWGYAKKNKRETNEYEVTHPRWQQYKVLDYKIETDFEKMYGKEFAFLNHQEPASVLLAEGSEITVEPKSKIR